MDAMGTASMGVDDLDNLIRRHLEGGDSIDGREVQFKYGPRTVTVKLEVVDNAKSEEASRPQETLSSKPGIKVSVVKGDALHYCIPIFQSHGNANELQWHAYLGTCLLRSVIYKPEYDLPAALTNGSSGRMKRRPRRRKESMTLHERMTIGACIWA